jgi:ATP-binding protein involved in chromosome partitioning
VPSLLGVEGQILADDDDDNPVPTTVDGMELMSVGLMTEGGPLAWRGTMAHDALFDLFADTAWDDPDALVIDLPPGTSDVLLTTLQEVPIDGVVFVTTPSHTSLKDTRRSRRLFEENGVPVLGCVVNMDRFVCEECRTDHDMFPSEAPTVGLEMPVLDRLSFSRVLQTRPEPGGARETFEAVTDAVPDRLAADRLELPDDPLDIRGLEAQQRVDRVRESFEGLDAGKALYLLSDRDPTPVGEFLADLADETGEPSECIPESTVEQRGLEMWALRAVHL